MLVFLQGRTLNYLQPDGTRISRNQQDALVWEKWKKLQTSSKWFPDNMDEAKIKRHMVRFSGHSQSVSNLMECGGESQHQRSQNNEGHRNCQQPVYDTEVWIGYANTWLSQTIILEGITLQKKSNFI